jgi:methionyl-tRNA formyltransferase
VRVVFMGSPAFALPSLEALVAAGHEVALVVSQAAKPVGRSGESTDPPVARSAKELGIGVFQPATLKDSAAVARLAEAAADVFVVVAYGKILPESVLELPRLGCVNVHGSLLPRWRGASPVQAALLAGDAETGISLMKMDAGMDTGPVYRSVATTIGPDEDAVSLSARLAAMGARLLVDYLPAIEDGELEPVPQDDARATACPKISREDGRIDWTRPAGELARRARAFTPWPGVFAYRGGARVKLSETRAVTRAERGVPGRVLDVGDEILFACGEDALSVRTLQTEGRRALPAREFARGERLAVGERFG